MDAGANAYEALDPLPATDGDAALELRDTFREEFARLGMDDVRVDVGENGRTLAIDPLSVGMARALREVVASCRASMVGAVVWCPTTRRVGEVIRHEHRTRVRLRSLANDREWTAFPLMVRPARLVEIDAARKVRAQWEQP
jgi:hypothetical protein